MSKIPAPWAPREPEPHPVKFEITATMPDGTRHVMVFDQFSGLCIIEGAIGKALTADYEAEQMRLADERDRARWQQIIPTRPYGR